MLYDTSSLLFSYLGGKVNVKMIQSIGWQVILASVKTQIHLT